MKEDVGGRERVKCKHRDSITKNCTNKEGNESFHHFTSSGFFNTKRDVDQKAQNNERDFGMSTNTEYQAHKTFAI